MSRRLSVSAFVVVVLVAGLAMAQTTTHEIRQGEVLAVHGNAIVVKMDTGDTREFVVPEGFEFMHNGEMVGVDDLEPGMILTADVKTTVTPKTVRTEEIRNGTVLAAVGQTLIVRDDDKNEIRRFKEVPSDMVFSVDGKEVSVYELREGMKLRAHIVHEGAETITEREVQAVVATGGTPAKPAPAPAPAPKPAPEPQPSYTSSSSLPKTGSLLPLAGLVGLVALLAGLGVGVIRRF
jgi:LPXTG-motif cell wall-anchored protein